MTNKPECKHETIGDRLDFIARVEAGEIEDPQELVAGVQAMINDGTIWQLDGAWGRTAHNLIMQGVCRPAQIH